MFFIECYWEWSMLRRTYMQKPPIVKRLTSILMFHALLMWINPGAGPKINTSDSTEGSRAGQQLGGLGEEDHQGSVQFKISSSSHLLLLKWFAQSRAQSQWMESVREAWSERTEKKHSEQQTEATSAENKGVSSQRISGRHGRHHWGARGRWKYCDKRQVGSAGE